MMAYWNPSAVLWLLILGGELSGEQDQLENPPSGHSLP